MKKITTITIILIMFTTTLLFMLSDKFVEPDISVVDEVEDAAEGEYSIKWIVPEIDGTSVRYYDHSWYYGTASHHEGLYRLEMINENWSGSRWGFVDQNGEIVIPFIYDSVQPFYDGLALVNEDGRSSFIDSSGKEIIDVSKYDNVFSFRDGFALVLSGRKFGIIDRLGNEVMPCNYDWAGWSKYNLWAGRGDLDNRKYALFDRNGVQITEMEFDYIDQARGVEPQRAHQYLEEISTDAAGPYFAIKEGMCGFINRTGNVVIPFQYDYAFGWTENIFAASKSGKWGHIGSNGKNITPFIYDHAEMFSEGLALVSLNGKWGYVDMAGNLVISCEYDEAEYFFNGVAAVTKVVNGANHSYVIDKSGKSIIGPKDYRVFAGGGKYIGAYYEPSSSRYSLLDKKGNRLTGFIYSSIHDFKEGFAVVYTNVDSLLRWGLLNQYGVEILPPIFGNVEIIDSNKCIVDTSEYFNDLNGRAGILTIPPDAAARNLSTAERPITIYLDGLELYLGAEPIIVNARVFVPTGKMFEVLGADISCDELTMIMDDISFISIRFVAEALNFDITWEADSRRVIIETPQHKCQF